MLSICREERTARNRNKSLGSNFFNFFSTKCLQFTCNFLLPLKLYCMWIADIMQCSRELAILFLLMTLCCVSDYYLEDYWCTRFLRAESLILLLCPNSKVASFEGQLRHHGAKNAVPIQKALSNAASKCAIHFMGNEGHNRWTLRGLAYPRIHCATLWGFFLEYWVLLIYLYST